MSKQIWAVNNHHKFGRIREKLILAGGQACYSIQPQFMRKGAFLKKFEIIWNYDILWILQILDGNRNIMMKICSNLGEGYLRLVEKGLNCVLITLPTLTEQRRGFDQNVRDPL